MVLSNYGGYTNEKIMTVLTAAIAVASLGYALNPTYLTLILCFVVTSVVVLVGLWIDYKIRRNGNAFLRRIAYYFTRKDSDYDIEQLQCSYSCLGNGLYTSKRIVESKSNRNDLQGLDNRYRWSAPSSMAIVEPIENGQSIKGMHQEDDWIHYTVNFGRVCKKGKTIRSGSIIKNLQDTDNKACPFLSCVIQKKTKQLTMSVEFPKDNKPEGEVIFKVTAYGKQVGENEVLEYNTKVDGYTKTVEYPRKGWRYVISWEKK